MATDYDAIAEQYREAKQAPWRLHAERWTLEQLLGDVRGLRVLELACGEGFHSRWLRQRGGAAHVLGIDLSERMIELASAEEARAPLGIEYAVGDARKLDLGESFDVVVAAYLLNYAADAAALLEMAQSIARHLRIGGRFVTINDNPAQDPALYAATRKYGFVKHAQGPAREGMPITYTCYLEDGGEVRFENYLLSRERHRESFERAGFSPPRWRELEISPEGLAEHGAAYWSELLRARPISAFDCELRLRDARTPGGA